VSQGRRHILDEYAGVSFCVTVKHPRGKMIVSNCRCSPRKEDAMKNILLSGAAMFIGTALVIFSVAPNFAAADEYEYGQGSGQSWSEKGKATDEMMPMGMHSMGGTIESIDHKTGWIRLKTGMGDMTLHYPPPAIKDLNKGDKITANLSYTKDEGKKGDAMMMKMK
jgi:hypothetical protein